MQQKKVPPTYKAFNMSHHGYQRKMSHHNNGFALTKCNDPGFPRTQKPELENFSN
jgi:hypothetical protein